MEKFLAENPAVKRLGVFLVTSAIIALNKKLGLGLGEVEIGALTTAAVGYLIQSGIKSAAQVKADAAQAGADAAAQVGNLEAAAAELGKPGAP